jgi:predicted GNAT family N-acyltransferase
VVKWGIMIDPYRIAAAEYAWDGFTAERFESPYGMFVHNTVRDDRAHATGLQFARCLEDQLPDFLAALEANYKRFGFTHRWITGFDVRSIAHLSSGLLPLGYDMEVYWALVRTNPSTKGVNETLEVRFSAPFQQDAFATVHLEDDPDEGGVSYMREMLRQLGGQEIVVYENDTPVAAGGYYVFGGITRFSRLYTRIEARGRGAASTLVQRTLERPDVASSDAAVLCVSENGPLKLYESLGFTRNNFFFNFSK